MSEHSDPNRLADELDREADELQEHSEQLQQEIGEVRQDWERKRADPGVPGAPPSEEQSNRDAAGDSVNPEDAGRQQPRPSGSPSPPHEGE